MGERLHCQVKLLDAKSVYLFHPQTKTQNRISETIYPKITSIPTSVKRLKINDSTTFHILQFNPKSTPKSLKPL